MIITLIEKNRKQKTYKVEYSFVEITKLLDKQMEEKQDWLLNRATQSLQNER